MSGHVVPVAVEDLIVMIRLGIVKDFVFAAHLENTTDDADNKKFVLFSGTRLRVGELLAFSDRALSDAPPLSEFRGLH